MAKPFPPKVLLLVIVLTAVTIPPSWKAKSLEKKLSGRAEESALLHKQAPDFQLASLEGEAVSLTGLSVERRPPVRKDFRGRQSCNDGRPGFSICFRRQIY